MLAWGIAPGMHGEVKSSAIQFSRHFVPSLPQSPNRSKPGWAQCVIFQFHTQWLLCKQNVR